MNLYIQTRQASVYEGDRKHLQTLVDAERAAQQKKCRIVERFIINGALKGKWYFRGTSAREDNWVIKGQLVKNDDKYYQPFMFPEKPADKYKLGLMYLSGERLVVNHGQAVLKIKDAAEWGHADAQFLLGLLYEKGMGVQKQKYHALKWIKKAADQGHKEAQQYLKRQEENAKLAVQKKIEAEKAARREGIVYKSDRFWQEFSNGDVLRKVFDGDFSGLTNSIEFKTYYIDFVTHYYFSCKDYLPPLKYCDERTTIIMEARPNEFGPEDYHETGRTTIYIDPDFTDAYDQYMPDVQRYILSKGGSAYVDMMLNLGKQGVSMQSVSDSITDVLYQVKYLEMKKFFNKVHCGSATMEQMRQNMWRAATSGRSLQASGIVLKNAAQESDPVEISVKQKTFKEACYDYHNRRYPDNYDRWCGCLDREARKVMTADELTHFADDFGSYYRDIDNQQKGPDDPRWRLQGPLNKCRR